MCPKLKDCGLRSEFELEVRGPIVRIPEEFQKLLITCQTSCKGTREEVDIAVWLQRKEMVEDLCLLCRRFPIVQFVSYPVFVEELEGVAINALRSTYLYKLEIFNWDKDLTVGFGITWQKHEIIHYWV